MSMGHTSNVYSMLDLSTAHIPDPEGGFPDFGTLRSSVHEYGWIVFVVQDPPEDEEEPDWIRQILAHARKYKCVLINFDQDASESDLFPTYEW